MSSPRARQHDARVPPKARPTAQSSSLVSLTLVTAAAAPEDALQPAATIKIEFSSFAHIEDKALREDKELLQALYLLRDLYGKRSQLVNSTIEELEDEIERATPRSAREGVLEALERGCSTAKQIRAYLDDAFSIRRINEVLLFLCEKNLAECRESQEREGSHHNRELNYFLTHTSPFKPVR
jgi:hypothetical protein